MHWKKHFFIQNTECFVLFQLMKKSPNFFPVLALSPSSYLLPCPPTPKDGIFVTIFCIQSPHTQKSFLTKERLPFEVVLWKMFHIIRSLTHHTDVSACLYKDLEQSVLATELTSKLFDPKFLYFDNAIMHLTQGHYYPPTYRKPS